jgi:hypothetical protein
MLNSAILHDGREQISQLSQNLSASLQDGSTRWRLVQTDMSGIHANLARADIRQEEQWSGLRMTLDQTVAACKATQTRSDEQLRGIEAVVRRVETKVEQQDTDNKLSLILEAVRSLMAGMNVRDEHPDSSSMQSQTDNGEQTTESHLQLRMYLFSVQVDYKQKPSQMTSSRIALIVSAVTRTRRILP